MNSDGVYSDKDFKDGTIVVNRLDYEIPIENGLFNIEGIIVCRYWGKKGNIILLVESDSGRKLKFSFWNNRKYCAEPEKKDVKKLCAEEHSVRYMKNGTRVALIYEKKESYNFTRVRWIERIT